MVKEVLFFYFFYFFYYFLSFSPSGDEFILKMRILDHVFDDVVVDNVIVKVVLPEGVRNIELE